MVVFHPYVTTMSIYYIMISITRWHIVSMCQEMRWTNKRDKRDGQKGKENQKRKKNEITKTCE